MALSIQQRIAHIENQLEKLKKELEEQEQEEQLTFIVTFRLNTKQENWGTIPLIPLSSERIREHIGDYLTRITDVLEFNEDGDRFDLLSVEEEFNTDPVSEPST